MISKEEIDSALTAHSQWKNRLKDAVDSGRSEYDVNIVKRDDACQFGKWLNSLSEVEKNTREYENIKKLHADFHIIASEILSLALNGKVTEAQEKLQFGGDYAHATGKLVLALNNWKSKL